MVQKVYKLRHKETGLFYLPQGDVNTCKVGKVYNRKPARNSWILLSKEVAEELGIECPYHTVGWKTRLDEWEVVTYEIKEITEDK